MIKPMRIKALPSLLTLLLAGSLAPVAFAGTGTSMLRAEEVGYFGSATVTHRVDVFAYSNLGPRDGMRVTVCVNGMCKRAVGHNAKLAWYHAVFQTRGLRMGAPVKFTVLAADSRGQAKVTVTKPLLCMHNNGSTPQS